MKALRVGLLIDDWAVPRWVGAIAADVDASPVAEIAAVVLNGSARNRPHLLPRYRPQPNPFRLAQFCLYLDQRLFQPSPDALEQVDVQERLQGLPVVETEPLVDDPDFRFNERDTRRLEDLDLDVLLWFWSGLPADEISRLARAGVWYFLDHQRLFAGHVPVGFSEVLTQAPLTVQCLQARLAGSADAVTLHRHYGPTHHRSIRLSRNNLFLKSVPFVSRKLDQLHRSGSLALADAEKGGGDPVFGDVPPYPALLKAVFSHAYRFLHQQLTDRRYFEQWVMAYKYAAGGPASGGPFADYRWLMPPKDRAWADPFPVQTEGQDYVFFEEIPSSTRKGHLCVAAIGQDGLQEEPKIILEREYHLSYPFVFSWQGDWYLIPETQEADRIDVYKFDSFPYKVSFYKTVMENVRAVDATLLEADGRWWMFAGITPPGTLNVDELFLFYADNPFGPWVPHRANPIKSDIRSARPAGRIFARDGKYYRPAQDCSHLYGYAIRLQEIKVLSTSNYAEEEVGAIVPEGVDMLATHTINAAGALHVIDAKMLRRK